MNKISLVLDQFSYHSYPSVYPTAIVSLNIGFLIGFSAEGQSAFMFLADSNAVITVLFYLYTCFCCL